MKSLFLSIALLCSFTLFSQTNLAGSYGYTLESPVGVTKDERAIPGGRLVLVKMEGNLYRFWLDVLSKGPDFNRVETDATISFINDTASFDNTFEDAAGTCLLKFKVNGKTISVKSHGGVAACGSGLLADGEYTWLAKQPKIDNAWLRTQYPHAPTMKVEIELAQMYADQDGLQSFTPKRMMMKGDTFLAIAETDVAVYTEIIRPDGTLSHGWLRKKDIKMKD